jgi:poly(glycerol-phosphate) alpha-glucosyltransferase
VTSGLLHAALHLPVNTLALRRGGLVKAVILRANALAAADPDRAVVIEVLAFQPRLDEDVADLVRRGFLDPGVHVRSTLAGLDPSVPEPTLDHPVLGCVHCGDPGVATSERPDQLADPRSVVLDDPRPKFRVRRAGPVLIRVPTRDDADRLRHVDLLTPTGTLVRREEVGGDDRVVRVLEFRPGDVRPVVHRWIGRDGSTFLSVWQDPAGRDWTMSFALLGGVTAMPNPHMLYRTAFEHVLRPESDPVLFSEFRDRLPNLPGRGFDQVVRAVRHPTLRRVAVVHSNHGLVGQQTVPMRSSPNFTALFEGLPEWDLMVTATERQREEIAEQYGHLDRIRAVAHHAPEPRTGISRDVDPNRFVLVARIHRKKRVDEAIQAFRLVVDGRPDARLEIYGFGYGDQLEATITALVDELDLRANVVFRGFVDDPSDIYAGACATLQTSESEGFGMALLESLVEGVPVVAYDVAYGAREAVRDGIDGYVVDWGDRRAMADRLLELANDPGLRARLSAEARSAATRFSRERYVREWADALATLPSRAALTSSTEARLRDGHLELRLTPPTPGTAVLRRRDRSDEVQADLEVGAARLRVPASNIGDILDVFVRDAAGAETRVAYSDSGPTDDRTWRVYRTEHGNLSLKKMPATAVGDGSEQPDPLGKRVVRRLRADLKKRRMT